jgi:SAM-dependent methyltransferase
VRYAIAIVSPPGYPHSAAFQEVGETLVHGLRRLGHDAVLGTDTRPQGRRAIVLGANLLPAYPQPLSADAVLYNLEQLDPGSPWLGPGYLELLARHEVWDYSARNAARYAGLGLPAPRVVPIGFTPELVRIPYGLPEEVDVAFHGSMNARRQQALEAIAGCGLRVEATYGLYGKERDARIARARIVLNVHFYEAKVFEVVRVSYLLANRRCVVSERGADRDEERLFEPGVAFADFGDLAGTCLRLARDPAARAGLAQAGYDLFSRRDEADILREVVGPARPESPPPSEAKAPMTSQPIEPAPPLSAADVISLAAPAGKRILDVACGDGEIGAALLAAGAAEVVGLDACARALTRSRLTATLRIDADATPDLPYPDGYFDVLLLEDLSALAAPVPALAHLRRWLSDEGRLVAVAPNGRHEAALASFLLAGTWPRSAGARPSSVAAALEAVGQAGFTAEDDALAVRTETGEAAVVLGGAAATLGADPAALAADLGLVRAVVGARPTARLGARAAPLLDPWRGSRPVKVLLVPDPSVPGWWGPVAATARGISGNDQVTLAVALPLALAQTPPSELAAALAGSDVDFLVVDAPEDGPAWERLLAGATLWINDGARPDLRALAARVGVDVQDP